MMKVLKNIWLVLLFIVITSFTPKSVITEDFISFNQPYKTQSYIPWRSSGVGYWTETSNYYVYNDFDFMVTRSILPNNYGYYFYDFWFYSQSYYWDGNDAFYTPTNVKNINVYVDNTLVISNYSTIGVTFNQTFNATSIRFITKSTQPSIYLKWGYMKAK